MGNDNQLPDRIVCTGNQFNKFIEHLVGRHPCAEIVYITQAVASEKLPSVVRSIIQEQNLQTEVQQKGLDDEIWRSIYQQVLERMSQEFEVEQGLSQNQIKQIVNCGQDLGLDQPGLQPQEPANQADHLSNHGLFAPSASQHLGNHETNHVNRLRPGQRHNN